jgi:hypothetical protein
VRAQVIDDAGFEVSGKRSDDDTTDGIVVVGSCVADEQGL